MTVYTPDLLQAMGLPEQTLRERENKKMGQGGKGRELTEAELVEA